MKIKSEEIINQIIGDTRLIVYKLADEKVYVLTYQKPNSAIVVPVERKHNRELSFELSTNGDESPSMLYSDNITLSELEKFTNELTAFVENEKEKERRTKIK